jgi:hypothetical protein
MEALTSHLSIGVSIVTAMATFYFWIVKAKQEQARLRIFPAEPHVGGHAQSSCSDPIKLLFEVKSIVANCSSLPNALLEVQAWVKMRDGGWQEAEARLDAKTPLPLNVPPLQTIRLDVGVTLSVPALPEGQACKNTHETFALYRDRQLAQPLQVKLAVRTLGEKMFASVLTSAKRAA